MGVFTEMEMALQGKLKSIAGTTKIQWENDDSYKPQIGVRYWRPTNLPIRSEIQTTGALQKHQGIYQVDVFAPSNKGIAAIMDDLDKIYTAYNTVLSLYANDTRIDIMSVGRGRIERDDSWCRGLIEINYVCFSH